MRRRGKVIGTTRLRLADRLASLGWTLQRGPEGLSSVTGGSRRWRAYDDTTVNWETWASHPTITDGIYIHLVSYDTMRDCCRQGTTVDLDGRWLAWVNCGPSRAKRAKKSP